MGNSDTFIGKTRSGKTNALIFKLLSLMLEGVAILLVDPQPDSSALTFFNACESLGLPCVHEDADSDLYLPCDFGSPSGDDRRDQLIVENLMQALFSDRNQGNAADYVQTSQHARPAILTKMYSGLPWHKLRGMWFSDFNRGLIERCNHEEVTEWLSTRPGSRSTMIREMQPAMRLLEPLTHGQTLRMRDVGESDTIEMLNGGCSVAVSGGRLTTQKELSFLCELRIMEVLQAAQEGRLTREVFIGIDESEILRVSPKVAQAIQSMEKYGVAFGIACQEPMWPNENYPVTEVVMQNTNHVWFNCNSPNVLDLAARDLAGLFDCYFVKRTRDQYRQVVRGFEEYDTESETFRKKGGSKTVGKRERAIYHSWVERIEDYMSLQEQANLLKEVISEFKPGECIAKIDGEIDTFYFPELNQWIGEQQEKKLRIGFAPTHQPPSNWLRRASSTQPKSQEGPLNDLPPENLFDPEALF